MLDSLITSKTRIKLLVKFFSNTSAYGHLRGLAEEFGESTNSVRVELNKLSAAGILLSEGDNRKIVYRANSNHPLFHEISSIIEKYLGFDKIAENIIAKLGDMRLAMVTGDYARGIDSGIIDLTIVGDVDQQKLQMLIAKAEKIINRKIRPLVLKEDEFIKYKATIAPEQAIMLWNSDKVKVVE